MLKGNKNLCIKTVFSCADERKVWALVLTVCIVINETLNNCFTKLFVKQKKFENNFVTFMIMVQKCIENWMNTKSNEKIIFKYKTRKVGAVQ